MVLRMDCLETPKDGVYSNMWHVYGLASVLNRTITSIYPEKNVRIRPLFNKIVHPRVQRSDQIGVPLIICGQGQLKVVNSTIHGHLITLYLAMCKMLYPVELQ